MGSIFAVFAAQYIGGMENLIIASPTKILFKGMFREKKTMMGHSVVTCQIRQNKEWRTTNAPLHHPTGQEAEMDDGNRWYGGNRRRSLRDHVPDPAVGGALSGSNCLRRIINMDNKLQIDEKCT